MDKTTALKFSSFRKGDNAALKILYEEFYTSVFYFAQRLIKRKDVAHDIVIDVFIIIMKDRKRFRNMSEVKAFLYTSVRNACFNYLKEQVSQDNKHKEILKMSGDKEDPVYLEEKAHREMIRTDVVEHLNEEIDQFPSQMRKVFELRLKKNCKSAVIARRLKTTVGTVRYQLHAGCERLKEKPGLHKRWMLLRILMRYE